MKIQYRFPSLTIAFTVFALSSLSAQTLTSKQVKTMENAVVYLADDRLEGRLTGSEGEKLAADFIIQSFKKSGIAAAGENGYLQSFDFTKKVTVNESETYLKLEGKAQTLSTDFYPLAQSGNAAIEAETFFAGYGIEADDLNHNDYKGNGKKEGAIFIIEISSPDGIHPHSKYIEHTSIHKKIETAIKHGAAGIVFVNSDSNAENYSEEMSPKVARYALPIVFSKKPIDFQVGRIAMKVQLNIERATGQNVVGFIDNKAAYTVVIGAHFDHLGYGHEGSLYKGTPQIHNGADDNASGTAMMLILAEYLKKSKWTNNNYLFIAFSGEELGLLGSNAFTKTELFSKFTYNYMINMDMVGRLDEKKLYISGTGTSPAWTALKEVNTQQLDLKLTESGTGPSDHTSFYLKDIPVLHFFTGTHNDYHKPSDDADKINFVGMKDVSEFILALIAKMDTQGKLPFTKTKDDGQGKRAAKFRVSLGVIPDYGFEGEGLKVDGVNEGRAAELAGLQAGDIVIQIGETIIKDIYAYMESLSKYKKGDKTEIVFKRGNEVKKTEVVW